MLIQINNICFSYPGGVEALRDISLSIQAGEMIALVGANGSGKTTLARHLIGLLQPEAGSIHIGNWQTSEHAPSQMARRVAYVFQNPDEQLFCQRVWDEVAFGPQNFGCTHAEVDSRVRSTLEWLNLQDVEKENPRDLIYSMRKRVALASALAMQTPIIILDEPTAGLDAGEQAHLSQVLDTLRSQQKTVMVITHNMDFAAENLDRFIYLRNGKVLADAPACAFFGVEFLSQTSELIPPQIVRLSFSLGYARPSLCSDQFLNQLSFTCQNGVPGQEQD